MELQEVYTILQIIASIYWMIYIVMSGPHAQLKTDTECSWQSGWQDIKTDWSFTSRYFAYKSCKTIINNASFQFPFIIIKKIKHFITMYYS